MIKLFKNNVPIILKYALVALKSLVPGDLHPLPVMYINIERDTTT